MSRVGITPRSTRVLEISMANYHSSIASIDRSYPSKQCRPRTYCTVSFSSHLTRFVYSRERKIRRSSKIWSNLKVRW
jgi:hypothetical protein